MQQSDLTSNLKALSYLQCHSGISYIREDWRWWNGWDPVLRALQEWEQKCLHITDTIWKNTESENLLGLKRPLRSSSPTISLTYWVLSLSHDSHSYIHTLKNLQGYGITSLSSPFYGVTTLFMKKLFPMSSANAPACMMHALFPSIWYWFLWSHAWPIHDRVEQAPNQDRVPTSRDCSTVLQHFRPGVHLHH